MPDGSFIVEIGGADYKALPPSTLKDIVNASEIANGELSKCQRARAVIDKQIEVYENTLGLLKRDRDLADKEAELERERGLRFSTMYTMEHDLRLESEQVNARSGTTRFFDSAPVQIAWKVGLPTLQAYLSSRKH